MPILSVLIISTTSVVISLAVSVYMGDTIRGTSTSASLRLMILLLIFFLMLRVLLYLLFLWLWVLLFSFFNRLLLWGWLGMLYYNRWQITPGHSSCSENLCQVISEYCFGFLRGLRSWWFSLRDVLFSIFLFDLRHIGCFISFFGIWSIVITSATASVSSATAILAVIVSIIVADSTASSVLFAFHV